MRNASLLGRVGHIFVLGVFYLDIGRFSVVGDKKDCVRACQRGRDRVHSVQVSPRLLVNDCPQRSIEISVRGKHTEATSTPCFASSWKDFFVVSRVIPRTVVLFGEDRVFEYVRDQRASLVAGGTKHRNYLGRGRKKKNLT